jgi:hypothetical protein
VRVGHAGHGDQEVIGEIDLVHRTPIVIAGLEPHNFAVGFGIDIAEFGTFQASAGATPMGLFAETARILNWQKTKSPVE